MRRLERHRRLAVKPPVPPNEASSIMTRFEETLVEPTIIEHFVGQAAAVERLSIQLDASFRDATALPHTLLVGSEGSGRRTLAKVLAMERGGPVRIVEGDTPIRQSHLVEKLRELSEQDVLIVTHLENLCTAAQVDLWRAARTGQLPGLNWERQGERVPGFTLLGLCENPAELPKPLRRIFKTLVRFEPYSLEQINTVLTRSAERLPLKVGPSVLRFIAEQSVCSPGVGMRLLKHCFHRARSRDGKQVTRRDAERVLELEGVDAIGAQRCQLLYLTELRRQSECKATQADLRAALGWPEAMFKAVETELIESEQILIEAQTVKLAPAGRRALKKRSGRTRRS
jgi:Holliday junction DNA helicase RuvB